MIALEILKACRERGQKRAGGLDLDEAISELQEAMKHKTCEGCNHLFFDEIEEVYKCINDVSDDVGYLDGEAVIRNIKDFYCAQYRSKDNA